MPVRHDPRTGKFMGGAGIGRGTSKPLPGMAKMSVDKLSRAHGKALADYAKGVTPFKQRASDRKRLVAEGTRDHKDALGGKRNFDTTVGSIRRINASSKRR